MELRLTENMRIWLNRLLDEEMDEASGAADNELIWSNGCDGEASDLHRKNAAEHLEYVSTLNELKNMINESSTQEITQDDIDRYFIVCKRNVTMIK